MAINPIELNGTISRSQDYLQMKHGEETRTVTEQQNFQTTFQKETSHRMNQVRSGDNVRGDNGRQDARERGRGEYSGDGGRRRDLSSKEQENGKVIMKSRSTFDVKI